MSIHGDGDDSAVPVCFAAGTPVLLADGTTRLIEQISRGEKVRTVFHDDPEGPISVGEVVNVYHNGPQKLVQVEIGGHAIRVTPKHPFYVRGRGWTAAAALRAGDFLRTATGESIAVGAVVDSGHVEPVYNIQVAGLHTYFVRNVAGNADVLVHNDSGKNLTDQQKQLRDKLVHLAENGGGKLKALYQAAKKASGGCVNIRFETAFLKSIDHEAASDPNGPSDTPWKGGTMHTKTGDLLLRDDAEETWTRLVGHFIVELENLAAGAELRAVQDKMHNGGFANKQAYADACTAIERAKVDPALAVITETANQENWTQKERKYFTDWADGAKNAPLDASLYKEQYDRFISKRLHAVQPDQ